MASFSFGAWDSEEGFLLAGSIHRASSSESKVWAEENRTGADFESGTFVAVNKDGGVKPLSEIGDRIHGIVVRDIYGDHVKKDAAVDVGHFSHGDSVVAKAVDDAILVRGQKAYIIATGKDAGKITHVKENNYDLGYWIEIVSDGNKCAAITLGYQENVTLTSEPTPPAGGEGNEARAGEEMKPKVNKAKPIN